MNTLFVVIIAPDSNDEQLLEEKGASNSFCREIFPVPGCVLSYPNSGRYNTTYKYQGHVYSPESTAAPQFLPDRCVLPILKTVRRTNR